MRTITVHWNILSKMRYTTCIVCFLFLRFSSGVKNFHLKRKIMSVDLAIISLLTYYFRSSTLACVVYCKYSAPSRQNLDVLLRFRIFLALFLFTSSSSSSGRASSSIHDPIAPPIAILQQSREVVWKASRVSTRLVDVGDCRVIVCVLTENGQ